MLIPLLLLIPHGLLKPAHVHRLQRHIAITPLQIAVDIVFGDPLANDVDAFIAHIVNGPDTAATDDLFKLAGIVAKSANNLSAIATAGAIAVPTPMTAMRQKDSGTTTRPT